VDFLFSDFLNMMMMMVMMTMIDDDYD